MAQVLDVTPDYYTGKTDEKELCSDEAIKKFLDNLGYKKLVAELQATPTEKPKRAYNRKPKATVEPIIADESVSESVEPEILDIDDCGCECDCADEAEYEEVISYEMEFSDEPEMRKAVDELSEDDAILLLKALFLRAKAGGEAETTAEVVKRCLLS